MTNCKSCTEPGFWSQAWSWLRAMTSKRDTKLGLTRITICRTRGRIQSNGATKIAPCEAYIEKGEKAFCGQCGCAQSGPMAYFSNLEYKTKLTKASCPLDFWE